MDVEGSLREEIDKLRGIRHPNIIQIDDVSSITLEEGEVNYYLMDFIVGQTLDVHLEKANALPHEIAELFFDILEGIQHLHENEVVHLDIKPDKHYGRDFIGTASDP